MIDVKEAARAAAEYFAGLFPDQGYSDVLLEEVELSEDEKYWLITLSYALPPAGGNAFASFVPRQRRYKQFKIDSQTGKVQAMTIRNVA
jgi:hypothetical protein